MTFTGGRGRDYTPHATTPSGRAASAPRWAPAAAAACLRVLREVTSEAGASPSRWAPEMLAIMSDDGRWDRLRRACERRLVSDQWIASERVLEHHRAHIMATPTGRRAGELAKALRALRRRADEAAPFPEIGIPEDAVPGGVTFRQWIIEDAVPSKLRKTQQKEGPMRLIREWGLEDSSLKGAICCARAGGRVREWRTRTKQDKGALPPAALRDALVHQKCLPTAVASRADHWWLLDLRRWMAPIEVTRAFGVRDESPLTSALLAINPITAVETAGRGIHAGVAARILRLLDTEGHLPGAVRYGSACSGVDFFAEALEIVRPGNWQYCHAAESDEQVSRTLLEAWRPRGLRPCNIWRDAASEAAANAPELDLFVISPECVRFSRRRHGRDAGDTAAGGVHTFECSPFLRRCRAAVVVMENVAEKTAISTITQVLRMVKGYDWSRQTLDPSRHAASPVHRERSYWIGRRVQILDATRVSVPQA